MHGPQDFLRALTVVLCVAAVTTVLFQKLRQPVVLGYLIAGLIVGPHLPVPLVADPDIIDMLSELGVILLMFSIGLEFGFGKLVRAGPSSVLTAVIQTSLMMWLGFLSGRALGWTVLESLFTGAIVAISSTTIVAKAFDELQIGGKLRETVVGVLIVEDLIVIVLLAIFTALATGHGLSAGPFLLILVKLVGFLSILIGAGLLIVPRAMRSIQRLNRRETTLVATIGICFAIALLAKSLGYSAALGAFLAGSLVAESRVERSIERLVEPVRDMFAAIFFVSVGMMMDPGAIARDPGAILFLTLLVVLGKVVTVSIGAFLSGLGLRTAIQAGMSLAQIGEFSFILAGLGLSLGVVNESLFTIAVAVSLITTFLAPWMIRASGPVASWIDQKLPAPLQTFAVLYGSWMQALRTAPRTKESGPQVRQLLLFLALDAALIVAVVIGSALSIENIAQLAREHAGIPEVWAIPVVVAAALLLCAPLFVGIVRVARTLGLTLAERAFPKVAADTLDLADAPRRMFAVALQVALLILIGAPLLALTQPFLPSVPEAIVLALGIALLAIAFWKRAANLQGHVRAGAQMIVQSLAKRSTKTDDSVTRNLPKQIDDLLPGLGTPVMVVIDAKSPAIGKSLMKLRLRGITGATVLAISHEDGVAMVPTGNEILQEGDLLVLAGTTDAIEAARTLLGAEPHEARADET
jgi:CPA2 family monovalent cation:H+ antiporter-2